MIFRPTLIECWIINQKKEIEFHVKRPLDSLLRQLTDLTYSQWAQLTTASKDTGGTARGSNQAYGFTAVAAAADTTLGIVVGTGTNAVTVSDYALQTKIAHGTGASQLSYQLMVFSAPVLAGSTVSFTMQRTYNNGSGGDITVQEVGLIIKSLANNFLFMIARDLTGGHLVQNTKSYLAQYTFGVTV